LIWELIATGKAIHETVGFFVTHEAWLVLYSYYGQACESIRDKFYFCTTLCCSIFYLVFVVTTDSVFKTSITRNIIYTLPPDNQFIETVLYGRCPLNENASFPTQTRRLEL